MQGVKGEAVVVLRRSLDNVADAVSSAFPKGKQHGYFFVFPDITESVFYDTTSDANK
jgi:hypothetical protein